MLRKIFYFIFIALLDSHQPGLKVSKSDEGRLIAQYKNKMLWFALVLSSVTLLKTMAIVFQFQ